MSVNEKMTALANEVRELSGTTDKMSIDEMTETLNAENTNFNSNLTTQDSLIEQIKAALQGKASGSNGGIDTSDATATASDILTGKTAYVSGQKITGNIAFAPAKTITPSTTSQIAISSGYYTNGDITVAAVPTQTKSATPTSSAQNITPDSGKFLSQVTVAGDSNLVADNIKKGASIFGVTGNYEGSGGGEVDHSVEDDLITRNLTTYTNDRITKIGAYAFYDCSQLTSINFPICTFIDACAFYKCQKLASINFPICTHIGDRAFSYCRSLASVSFPACSAIYMNAFERCINLKSIYFPVCTNIGSNAFSYCTGLTKVSFPACVYIYSSAFVSCTALTSADFGENSTSSRFYIYPKAFLSCKSLTNLTLRYSFVTTLSNIDAFTSTPMSLSTLTGSFGSIYVPASLVASYKAATNWATYADRITAIVEELTLINFTIEEIGYQAEEGMTWEEWVNSEYNIDGYVIATSGKIEDSDRMLTVYYRTDLSIGDSVSSSDEIIADYEYLVEPA